MSDDRYRNLRGGAISHVSGLTPSTVASWGLNIGERKGEGHPRYNLADAVAVLLMKELTVANKLMAGRAAHLVNSILSWLPPIIDRVREENRDRAKWSWEEGPYAIIGGLTQGGTSMLAVVEDGELAEFIRTSRQQSLFVLPLRRHINSAIMRLDNYLWNEGHAKIAEQAAADQEA